MSDRKETGSETWGDRPGVIVSNNANNRHSPTVEVCYTTTKPKNDLPTHFITEECFKPSTVLCEQIRTISVNRIGTWIGTLSDEEMEKLDECLAVSVGIVDAKKADNGNEVSRQQLEEALEKQKAAEKQAKTYKEMYEFLLAKQIGE